MRINETRANACQIVAWRYLYGIPEGNAVNFCLYELPATVPLERTYSLDLDSDEWSDLSPKKYPRNTSTTYMRPDNSGSQKLRKLSINHTKVDNCPEPGTDGQIPYFTGLNGLEIAAVADCKAFLSQDIVQRIVTGIWKGDIIFWESLNNQVQKRPQFYNSRYQTDIFARLRVPRYNKLIEVLFLISFLFLQYGVLVERNLTHIKPLEIFLYIWLLALAHDELGDFIDAGSIFYFLNIWNGCDLIIIIIGFLFMLTRFAGIIRGDTAITGFAFDILSLEVLFMVPRTCSLLSLQPYFGTLIPCLKKMVVEFVKFMAVVAVFYIGFLSTFALLARGRLSLEFLAWLLVKIIFGSSYMGFEVMTEINPIFGPPLMLIYVCMTNILLITSLISILSESFSKVTAQAREEYLFVYSIYVLESASSNRLTHFCPPFNIIPLILIRPLRIFLPASQLRNLRIIILKIIHLPIVGLIWVFENLYYQHAGQNSKFSIIHWSVPQYTGVETASPKNPLEIRQSRNNTNLLHLYDIVDSDDAEIQRHIPKSYGKAAERRKELSVITEHEDKDLKTQVNELSEKIEKLYSLITKYQSAQDTKIEIR